MARMAGPNVLSRELKRQIYSKSYFVGMERDLNEPFLDFKTDIDYTLQRGKESDINEILTFAKTASKESAYELLMRIRFYNSGFRNFYVARAKGNGELCYLGWLLSSAEHPELRDGLEGIPPIKENEILMFNLFAFEKYRGRGLAASIDSQLCKIAMENGYKRAIAYTLGNNKAALKTFEKIGFKKYCWKLERRYLFSVRRKFGNELKTFPNPERL
jgi:RimJ/RimL family protein N-acetyltransferase